ncbi:MAG: universal stress protein [Gemmatimonadetes bacterium]|nr:universal stress protein [Gemmatimonadota bacterium]
MTIRRILVPLDGSPLGEAVLSHAASIARAFDAEILLVRVMGERRAGRQPVESAEWRLRRSEAVAYLEGLAARLVARGVTARAELGQGGTVRGILEAAREHAADLIAFSRQGRNGPNEFGLGGTATKIVSHGGLSFLLVEPGSVSLGGDLLLAETDGEVGTPDAPARRVLVAVDGSHRGEWALNLAARVARAARAELVIAHVVPVPAITSRTPLAPEDSQLLERIVDVGRSGAEEYLAEASDQLATPDLPVRTVLEVSPQIAQTIFRIAEREKPALVVLSAHGTSDPGPWRYGTVASALVANSPFSLLVFQDVPRLPLPANEPARDLTAQTDNGWSR